VQNIAIALNQLFSINAICQTLDNYLKFKYIFYYGASGHGAAAEPMDWQ